MKRVIDIPQEYWSDIQKDIIPASGADSEKIMFDIIKSSQPYESEDIEMLLELHKAVGYNEGYQKGYRQGVEDAYKQNPPI